MEQNERIKELVEVMRVARLLDDFAKLPAAVMKVQFADAAERDAAFACATETVMQFVLAQIEIACSGVADLTGELAEVTEERDRLVKQVKKLQKRMETAVVSAPELDNSLPHCPDPPPPPPARASKGRSKGATSPLPEFVERRSDKFGCNVQRKGLKFRKGGFETPDAAHAYAVERIEKHGGGKTTRVAGGRRRSGYSKDLPQFVYRAGDRFRAMCNRKDIKFDKWSFTTAALASEWAEAEFARLEAGGDHTPSAGPPPATRVAPGMPRTRADTKAAIAESRQRNEGAKS